MFKPNFKIWIKNESRKFLCPLSIRSTIINVNSKRFIFGCYFSTTCRCNCNFKVHFSEKNDLISFDQIIGHHNHEMGHDYIYRNVNLLSTTDKDIIKAKTIDGALSGDITKALKKYIRPNDLYNSRRPGIINRNNDQVAELKSTLIYFFKKNI